MLVTKSGVGQSQFVTNNTMSSILPYLGVRQVECTLFTSSIAFFHVAVD